MKKINVLFVLITAILGALAGSGCSDSKSPFGTNPPVPTNTSLPTATSTYTACVNSQGTPCTSTPTFTSTSTATATSSPTPSFTPTLTFTRTSTGTPTNTATVTSTFTPTYTTTVTSTFTITYTPTVTGTFTATSTSYPCTLMNNTVPTATSTSGCYLVIRETGGCQASRTAQGLSGAWLKFSCRVGMQVTVIGGQSYVQLTSDDQPDYQSNYFPAASACHMTYHPSYPDPNTIVAQGVTEYIPLAPNTAGVSMGLGAVGMAINGVEIYDNQAAPGDSIFDESGSFDECGGHPDNSSSYHYHSEPYSISNNDDNLIGVMRDGYFIYGRLDSDGSCPASLGTLDAYGGETGVTPDSNGVAVYHYHLNKQSGLTAKVTPSAAVTAWFMTTGLYRGAPGP